MIVMNFYKVTLYPIFGEPVVYMVGTPDGMDSAIRVALDVTSLDESDIKKIVCEEYDE